MTTKVRITNIVDEATHSNGDVLIGGANGPDNAAVLNPGESHEQWLRDGEPLIVTERWPSEPKTPAA